MRKFFMNLLNKIRTLQIKILSLFLSLIIIAFLAVLSFTFFNDYKFILEISESVAKSVTERVLERFEAIAQESESTIKIAGGFWENLGPLQGGNEHLISYLLNVVKYDPTISTFYFGLPDGSFYGAFDHQHSSQDHYISDPSRTLPESIAFSLEIIDRSQTPFIQKQIYLNEKFEEIVKEDISSVKYNSTERLWYRGAADAKKVFWSPFYLFKTTNELGITVANPIYDKNNKLALVIGADISMTLFSEFLSHQKVGENGKAFILNKNGDVIVPYSDDSDKLSIYQNVIDKAYSRFLNGNTSGNAIYIKDDIYYIAYVGGLPIAFGNEWLIVTVAPLLDFFKDFIVMQKQVIVITVLILILTGIFVFYFSKRISSPIVILSDEIHKITQLELNSKVRVNSKIKEINLMDVEVSALRSAIGAFAKFVPKEIIKELFQKSQEIVLGGEKKELTIFFSDIANFTTIAESCSIEVLTPLLREYFEAMTHIILESHGTLDKFLGDGIMAFWGAPTDILDHADAACKAALKCQALLISLNKRRKTQGQPEFITRIGINTGTVVVGNIGTEDRMNYTVIGDAVNVTARLQDIDKVYHTSIIISDDVLKKCRGKFLVRPLDFVAVKGKITKIKIYELVALLDADALLPATLEQIELCKTFSQAYESFDQKEYETARTLFQKLSQKFPDDFPTQIYLNRLKELP